MQVFFVSTLATNIAATGEQHFLSLHLFVITDLLGLLGYRIWSIDRKIVSHRHGKSNLTAPLQIIIDAGILYSVSLLVAIGCYAAKTNGLFVVLDMVSTDLPLLVYPFIQDSSRYPRSSALPFI